MFPSLFRHLFAKSRRLERFEVLTALGSYIEKPEFILGMFYGLCSGKFILAYYKFGGYYCEIFVVFGRYINCVGCVGMN